MIISNCLPPSSLWAGRTPTVVCSSNIRYSAGETKCLHLFRSAVNNELKNHLFSIRRCCWIQSFPLKFSVSKPFHSIVGEQNSKISFNSFQIWLCAIKDAQWWWKTTAEWKFKFELCSTVVGLEFVSSIYYGYCCDALLLFIWSAEQITITSCIQMAISHIRKLIRWAKIVLSWTENQCDQRI